MVLDKVFYLVLLSPVLILLPCLQIDRTECKPPPSTSELSFLQERGEGLARLHKLGDYELTSDSAPGKYVELVRSAGLLFENGLLKVQHKRGHLSKKEGQLV